MPDQDPPSLEPGSSFSEPIGDPSKMRPGFTGNEDLEGMYVQSSVDKDHQVKLRAGMLGPDRKGGLTGCSMVLLVLLGILILATGYLAIAKTESFDEDGVPYETSKLKYYVGFFGQNDRIRMLRGMEPRYRTYFLTRERIELIYAYAAAYLTRGDAVPSTTEMVGLGLLREAQISDGWGTPIVLQVTDKIRVLSAGIDRNLRTGDDISCDAGSMGIPLIYRVMEDDRGRTGSTR